MWTDKQTKISVTERRARIVEDLNRAGTLSVAQICETYGVSEVTARHDLTLLEKEGKLKRQHGGAISLQRTITVSYPDQRMNINVAAKRSVAQYAAGLVRNGDAILVDTGTTTIEFVKCLYDKKNITIVTNDLSIAVFADSSLPHADVLLLGGSLRKNHRYITGSITSGILESLYLDKAFLATDSFHPDFGFTTEYMGNADIKRLMSKHAREVIMLMDASKLRDPCFVNFGQLSDVDCIVINEDPQGQLQHAIDSLAPKKQIRLCITHNKTDLLQSPLDSSDDDIAALINSSARLSPGRQKDSHLD